MKKKFLFLMASLAVSLLALAEMTIFVYQKDGEKVEYLAANVDSIGFVNFHTIVFDANGGDGSMDALRVKESESVNLPANIFTKSAFAFTGWNTAADGSGTAYTDQSTITITAKITLFAQWEPMHAITFNANGGEGNMDVFYVKDGESVTLPANTFTNGISTFVGWNTAANGSGTAYADKATVKPTANMILYAQWLVPEYEYVDLGLPSGLLWATMNVGAESPEDYGDYFAWGETSPKEVYNWSTYKWCNGSSDTQTKYCTSSSYGTVDNKTVLDLSDDAANANWGADWRMPTDEEREELQNTSYTTWTWTTKNGVQGYKVASKINGNSIFLPAAGYRSGSGMYDAGSDGYPFGYYWSSSLHPTISDYAFYFWFNWTIVDYSSTSRCYGHFVRPVLRKTYTITFDANGGEGSMEVISLREEDSVTLTANAFTQTNSTFAGWNTAADGSGTAYTDQSTITPTANMTLYAQWEETTTGTENGHEWVDLGLPSGTKWATMNVGADSPEDYGDYFAWGETTPKSSYTSSNYNYSGNPTTLPLDRDAAYTNWGTSWRMPTDAELKELKDNCTCTWTTQNGVEGYKVTSKTNGNSIFLPAAGDRSISDLNGAGSGGYYWSSSRSTSSTYYAYSLGFNSDRVYSDSFSRYDGRSVRPVLAK